MIAVICYALWTPRASKRLQAVNAAGTRPWRRDVLLVNSSL